MGRVTVLGTRVPRALSFYQNMRTPIPKEPSKYALTLQGAKNNFKDSETNSKNYLHGVRFSGGENLVNPDSH